MVSQHTHSAADVHSPALQMAAAEFPELAGAGGAGAGQALEQAEEAQHLRAACAAAGLQPWAAALALLVGDAAALAGDFPSPPLPRFLLRGHPVRSLPLGFSTSRGVLYRHCCQACLLQQAAM